MRRTLALVAFVAVGIVLVVAIEPPRRPTGAELARGPRLFRTSPHGIRRIEAALGDRRVVAERTHEGWSLDGTPARPLAKGALDALATQLATQRAVDAFRVRSFPPYGLEPPSGTIVVTTRRDVQRLALGTLNSVGSTFYARRDRQPRVMQVGVYLLETLQRVFDQRDPGARARGYWPEIG